MSERQLIDISSGTIFRVILILLGLVFLWMIRHILLLLLVSIIIASALEPLAARLQRFRIPRPLSVLAVYILVIAALIGVGTLLIPPLGSQIRELADLLPKIYNNIMGALGGAGLIMSSPEAIEDLQGGLVQLSDLLSNSAGNFLATTKNVFGNVVDVILVFIISFYLVINRNGLVAFIRSVTPAEHQPYVISLVERAQNRVSRWAGAQLLLGLIVGVLVYIGLWGLGMREYALALALLAGFMELIPIVGPILAAIPAVFLGLTQAIISGLLILLLYVVIQQIENQVLVPLLMRRAVGLNPLITIIAILVGAKIAGLPGVILAVPITTILSVFLSDLIPAGKEEELPA